jgi:PAS domain S-box-containing protein
MRTELQTTDAQSGPQIPGQAPGRTEERLTLATQSAGIGIWDWDVVTDGMLWDGRMCELYGIKAGSFRGGYSEWQAALHPDDRARVDLAATAALNGGEPFNIEFRVVWPNREVHTLEAHAQVQRAPDGSATRATGVNWDVSERVETERTRHVFSRSVITALSAAIESRDPYTAGHQGRVATTSLAVAIEIGLDADTAEGIELGAHIHDIGKIAIFSEILTKPTPLNALEWQMVQTHSQVGHDIAAEIAFQRPIAEMILQHHERLDGSGYPAGLRGDAIAIGARVIAVGDTIDAMTTTRPYGGKTSLDEALDELQRGRGVVFDPIVVDACIRLFHDGRLQLEPRL